MRFRRLTAIALSVIALATVLSSCDESSGAGMEPTITLARANQVAEDYVERARTVLPPSTKLELQEKFEDYPCTDPDDQGPAGRRIASRTYQVDGLQKSDIPAAFDAVLKWAGANHFSVLKHEPVNEYLWLENKGDGFRMTIEANRAGELFVGSSSPCVWPEGTPPE